MTQIININLGKEGSIKDGFPNIILRVMSTEGFPSENRLTASLPPNPDLISVYQNWKTLYSSSLMVRLFSRTFRHLSVADIGIEIEPEQSINFSEQKFTAICADFQQQLNQWLKSETYYNPLNQIKTYLDPSESIELILETVDDLALRLPWNLWDFFEDYPRAELAVSLPEDNFNSQPLKILNTKTNKLKILAILGNPEGLNLEEDKKLIKQTKRTQIKILQQPTIEEIGNQLTQNKWDILFFAGHSSSSENLLEDNDLSVFSVKSLNQLTEPLKQAIKNGLKLAIFNSCDGIAIGKFLIGLDIPQVCVMREVVPDGVAHKFLGYFLSRLQEQNSLLDSIGKVRKDLEELEPRFPCASWLPVVFQHPKSDLITRKNVDTKPAKNLRISLFLGAYLFLIIGSFFFGNSNLFPRKIEAISKTDNSQVSVNVSSEGTNYFYWRLVHGIPTTFMRPHRGDVPFIEWASLYFEKAGYSPEVRATQVTNRLNLILSKCPNPAIIPDQVKGRNGGMTNIIKAVDYQNGCNDLVYTLRDDVNPQYAAKLLGDKLKEIRSSEAATDSPLRQ